LKPVQLVREEDATAGGVARDVPTYEPGPCESCPYTEICKQRGDATAFKVHEVRADPLYCQKIDGNLVPCRADHFPELEEQAEDEAADPDEEDLPVYLADASVFINAERWQWEQCQLVLRHAGSGYRLATTTLVRDELHHSYELPAEFDVVAVDPEDLHPDLVAAAEANRDRVDGHEASEADLSLVQAAIDDDRFEGILSEDLDHEGLHPPSLVREIAGHEVEVLTCDTFCRGRPGLFPAYES
jgi:hypothetical protein